MRQHLEIARTAALAVLSLAVVACRGVAPTQPATTAAPVELVVAAAASLRDALTQAADRYEHAYPGVRIRLDFDASSALRTQIEQGAPIDVFLSADTSNPQQLVDHRLAAAPVTTIAHNRLVIVVPRASPIVVKTPLDLARKGVKLVAAAADVPISNYTAQLVAQLARQPGYPANYADRVAANVVSREDNVRAIVAKVALGEGDAGVVYATDAAGASVGTVEIPAAANVTATYGGATVAASAHPAEAATFLRWLAGPAGQAVLASFGFLPATG